MKINEYVTRLSLDWSGEKPIEDIEADIQVAKEYGVTHIRIDIDPYSVEIDEIALIKKRDLTPEEIQRREEAAAFREKQKEEREYKEYLKLKEKFES